MKYLAPIPKQFVDQSGLPLSDGKVHVYISGDTQYADVYQDADGEELMPNPAKLDSNGAWVGFVTAGVPLDYVVEDKEGNVQFEYEKVVAGGEGGGGGTISAVLPLKVAGGVLTNNGSHLTCTGTNAWAEGQDTKATGVASHAEGLSTIAQTDGAHAEGNYTVAKGDNSHAEGYYSKAYGASSHAEGGSQTGSSVDTTKGGYAHSEGRWTYATGNWSHVEGQGSNAMGDASHAEGLQSLATSQGSHAEGAATADANYSHAEGASLSRGAYSHAEGYSAQSKGDRSHAEGYETTAQGENSHSEGYNTNAYGTSSHAEGISTHTGDALNSTKGSGAHSEGYSTEASGENSHAEGYGTKASGDNSHAGGEGTRATGDNSTAIGKYNDDGTALFVVGDGTDDAHRDDAFKVDSNGETWVKISGVLTKITSLGGGTGIPIYATLQDAITDQANLPVGTIFQTNGFYASGDGGAARYVVSSTGTANGMDIVSMATGKNAILQVNANREMFPEQFGYKRDANRYDLTPYLVRMTTMPSTPVRNIRLMPTSSSSAVYVMRTTWNVTAADVSITGHSGFTTGHATQVWFLPDSYETDYTPMFKFAQRGFVMKNLVLLNRPWFADGDKHNCVCLYMAIVNTNKMWYDFDQLAIQGFDIGIAKVPPTGELNDGLIWHCEFHRLAMALNNKNIYFKGITYLTKFDNCFLTVNNTGAVSITLEESFSTEFDRCNFGIYSPAETILLCQDFIVSGKAVDVRWSQCKFTNCNFELEYDDSHPLPTNTSGFFVKCEDHDDFNLEFNNCCFIATPLARQDIYSNRLMRLGAKTKAIFRQCAGPYVDVNYTGNEYYGWTFKKYFFDENHPPKKELGSLLIEHCVGIMAPPNNAWGSAYLPVVKDDTIECPLSDNNTKFIENYPTVSDGIVLVNLDKANLEVKLGSSMVQVTSPGTGKIRIGDRIYDYVTIDGRKWITANLQLWTMNTRQWHFPDHEEFGFYYGIETFPEVDALLPAGWRRPNYADCQSIISQGYAAVQALGQSAFPSATNTTGLSILPCYRWVKPNTSVTFNRGFFWGPEEVGVGWHAVNVQAANISYAGWPYSDANGLKIPLRVCCDA